MSSMLEDHVDIDYVLLWHPIETNYYIIVIDDIFQE